MFGVLQGVKLVKFHAKLKKLAQNLLKRAICYIAGPLSFPMAMNDCRYATMILNQFWVVRSPSGCKIAQISSKIDKNSPPNLLKWAICYFDWSHSFPMAMKAVDSWNLYAIMILNQFWVIWNPTGYTIDQISGKIDEN